MTRMIANVLSVAMTALVLPAGANAQSPSAIAVPSWLQAKIAEFEAGPSEAGPVGIWRIQHKGEPAYSFLAPCCDQRNPLFSETGKYICSPSGGFEGGGDGRCRRPMDAGSAALVIWVHSAAQDRDHLLRLVPPTGLHAT